MAGVNSIGTGTRGASINDGSKRMNAATRSIIGSFFKAEEITTALFKNGVQMEDEKEIKQVLSSWYLHKSENAAEWDQNHYELLNKVVGEIATTEPIYWAVNGLTEEAMIASLNNKLCRIALTTAAIIPVNFRIGDDNYQIKTIKTQVTGPNPLLPDGWTGKTCSYSNARNASDVISYWPDEVTDRLIQDLADKARVQLVYLDESDRPVAQGKGLPAVLAMGKVLIAYKKDITLKKVDNSKIMDFFGIRKSQTSSGTGSSAQNNSGKP